MNRIQTSKIYPWVVVALLWVVALLNYMDRQMLSTMRDAMQFDITELESAVNFGRLMAIFLWIYGFMSPVAGAVADRISRKWLIVVSLGVWSTVTLLMGYSTTFTQIYWLRALMGVSEALYIPAGLSLIADYFTGSRRSLAIGIHMTGLYVGQAVGGFGATVAAAFSWQTTFHWFGIVGIVYALVLILLLHEKRRERPEPKVDAPKPAGETVWRSFALLFSNIAFWTILFYFASSSLPGLGDQELAPDALLREPPHPDVAGRTALDHHHRLFVVPGRDDRRTGVRPLGAAQPARAHLHQRHRAGPDDPGAGVAGTGQRHVRSRGRGALLRCGLRHVRR